MLGLKTFFVAFTAVWLALAMALRSITRRGAALEEEVRGICARLRGERAGGEPVVEPPAAPSRLTGVAQWLAAAAMPVALAFVFLIVPSDRDQGVLQRIFYFHVSSAWMAFSGFLTVAAASAIFLWRRSTAADILARAAAEVGLLFCTLVLVTGPIWAYPAWGTAWTWDPRLTMTLILWTIYASYLVLRAFGGNEEAVARYAAVLGIVGVLDIPIIIVSVRLLRGIHPAVLMRREGGTGLSDPLMVVTLLAAAIAFLLVFLWLLGLRYRSGRLERTVAELRQMAQEEGA